MRRALALTVALMSASCHVVTQIESTRPLDTERIRRPERAVARQPMLRLTDAGTLRFVEPLDCPTEERVAIETSIEVRTGPNLATFVVGVIATAIGGLFIVRGASDSAGTSPYTYGGLGAVAVGLPLAIVPWIGTHTELRAGEQTSSHRAGPNEPCGERPLAARAATLAVRGIEVHGRIDRDGTFAISPYQLVDAYDPRSISAAEITATVETNGGARRVLAVLDAGALARHAAAFLSHADFDAQIQPLRLVPNVSAGTLRVSLAQAADGPALRIVLPLKNDGPGDAFALRGQITASTHAADGRLIYFGVLRKGASATRELLVPLSDAAAAMIRGESMELSVELRDAHGTAPATPIRFRGTVLGDAPR